MIDLYFWMIDHGVTLEYLFLICFIKKDAVISCILACPLVKKNLLLRSNVKQGIMLVSSGFMS